jgi:hypothetical protein
MLRKGPAVVRGLEAEEEESKTADVRVDVVAKETEADVVG